MWHIVHVYTKEYESARSDKKQWIPKFTHGMEDTALIIYRNAKWKVVTKLTQTLEDKSTTTNGTDSDGDDKLTTITLVIESDNSPSKKSQIRFADLQLQLTVQTLFFTVSPRSFIS